MAKDDLAIREIALHHSRSDKSSDGESKLVLFDGPPILERRNSPKSGTEVDAGDNRTVEHRWDLARWGLSRACRSRCMLRPPIIGPWSGRAIHDD